MSEMRFIQVEQDDEIEINIQEQIEMLNEASDSIKETSDLLSSIRSNNVSEERVDQLFAQLEESLK